MSEEIKPCPFCGGKGSVSDLDWESGYKAFVDVSCDSCGAATGCITFNTYYNCKGGVEREMYERQAIGKWNQRAAQVPS